MDGWMGDKYLRYCLFVSRIVLLTKVCDVQRRARNSRGGTCDLAVLEQIVWGLEEHVDYRAYALHSSSAVMVLAAKSRALKNLSCPKFDKAYYSPDPT
jgi:hypothetical protein